MAQKNARLGKLIDGFREAPGTERNLYDSLKKLLTDAAAPTRCEAQSIVIDSAIPGTACAPDLTLYLLGDNGKPVVTASHVFASIEVKRFNRLASDEEQILADKSKYITSTTRFLFLIDQEQVIRFVILPGGTIGPRASWRWSQLKSDVEFVAAFGPISAEHARVSAAISAFKRGETGFAYVGVDDSSRREFIDAVRVGAAAIREAVLTVLLDVVKDQVRVATAELNALVPRWGVWSVEWSDAALPFVTCSGMADLSGGALLEYENHVDQVMLAIEPYAAALKLETVVLPRTAARMGLEGKVSLLLPPKDSKNKLTDSGKAIESLGYETSSMILSRMLMIRFAEDHGLLQRYICNGGIEQFSNFAAHFKIGAQGLLREVYRKARDLYSSIFSADPLDWAVQGDDAVLSEALLHAMWLLSRWDFTTVKGDILSGVYDKFLDVAKRRALGEVYTRPEICRYMLARCAPSAAATVFDPACGSGTFLVEHLHAQLERLRSSGALNLEAVQSVLQRIHGLDLNPFSAVLTQIQILWQLLEVFADQPPDHQKKIAKALIPHIMVEGGHTSLDPFDQPMEVQTNAELDLGQADTGGRRHSGARGSQVRRRLKAFATGRYDVVVANPPYVRYHRHTLDERTRAAYGRVIEGQPDLYIMFLYRALRSWLKPGGRTAFIIPIAVLEADYAEKLRSVIAEYKLIEVMDLEPLRKLTFRGVKRQTVILVLENSPSSPDDLVTVAIAGTECFDVVSDRIDLQQAVSSQIPRRFLNIETYFGATEQIEETV
ncbi:N-6 DNA methylase [Variovorax sp. J22P240]|uniref:HsdM family class I SAM-dependent methyltransferase n=1 Tax=Variovorax sp. J22P240 TaxID=3053514 RepID=UPI0025780963|nr:N-6 DNA methylase [Variovorax sp. J22P240]MDM0002709.1 N-6 DNA methylase [Variovorax sp. J22P240]